MATPNQKEQRLYKQNVLRANLPQELTSGQVPVDEDELVTPDFTYQIWSGKVTTEDILRSKLDLTRHACQAFVRAFEIPQSLVRLRKSLVEQKQELLNSEYSGKIVALTYDGKILGSAENTVELLKYLAGVDYPADQIFLHPVGREPLGWL